MADSVSLVPSFGLHGGQNRFVWGVVCPGGWPRGAVLHFDGLLKTGDIRRKWLISGDFEGFVFYGTQFRLVIGLCLRN